jgi:MOSC domain-containing protein YiiM
VWRGRTVTTAIYKNPVEGRFSLGRLNLDGGRQADLTVHGGAFKAVYCYPIERYGPWTFIRRLSVDWVWMTLLTAMRGDAALRRRS